MAGRNNKAGRSAGGFKGASAAANPNRLANAKRILRARANRGSADQRRSTADGRMYSENKARMALGFYTGTRRASAMRTGAEVRAKMLASLRRSKGLPEGKSGFREPAARLR